MKTKFIVFMSLLLLISSSQCQAKELKKNNIYITPMKVIKAAVEVFTCTSEKPVVKRVEVKEVNGRKTVVPVDSSKKK